MKNTSLLFFILIVFYAASCSDQKQEPGAQQVEAKQRTDTVVKGIFHAPSELTFDSVAIPKFLAAYPQFRPFENDFMAFYAARKFSYAWFDNNGMIEQTQALWNNMQEDAINKGKSVSLLYKESLDSLMHPEDLSDKNSGVIKANTNAELMLTGQYFNYAKNIWGGWSDAEKYKLDWYLPAKKLPYAKLLDELIAGKTVDELENTALNKQYLLLRSALKEYKGLETKDTLAKIPALHKPSMLKPGDSSAVIISVKRKLHLFGLLQDTTGGKTYSAQLVPAVTLFKKTHNLNPDSVIDNSTIEELNVPVKKRIEQIVVNMERFTWVPPVFNTGEFIVVNIPEFVLHYFEGAKEVWDCNVVVGKPVTKTVIFSGEMKYVVFSPYWNVPTSIINSEIKPGMRRNPNYLAAHNMEWNGGRVRQKPGVSNSLGLVKFLFPNSNNIYLHDTPSKSLFNKNERAFSHGCIRVAKPRDLAIRILRQDTAWTPEKIDAAMNAGKEKMVTLKKQVPVYIGYFTAFFDKEGHLHFCKDIYNRDNRVLEMIAQ